MTRALLFALCLPLAAQAQFSPAPLPKPLQRFPDAARMQFGTISVPQNRSNPADTSTIQLAVVIVPALNSPRDPDAVFYIVGGPGGSATLSSGGFPIFTELNRTRDIVYVDPRGSGFSQPNLYMRRDAATIRRFVNENRAWFAARGIDVTAYNASEMAEDYEAARIALGYGQINIFANSYGTFVAQELLRRHPSSLRAAVMSGNSPATDPFLPTTLQIQKAGFDALVRDVSTNPRARRAFPNFRKRFFRLMTRLSDRPLKLRLPNRDTGRTETVVIDGEEFAQTLTELLQVASTIRYIPLLVTQMERKNYGSLARRFFAPDSKTRRDDPFGAYLSVLGTDFAAPGYAKATLRGILRTKNKAIIGAEGSGIYQLAELVVGWNVPYAPGTTRTLPQSPVRTLLVNGMMDAQTPATGGATIAAGLSGSTNYVYPRVGHGVGFDPGPDMDAAAAFIRNPSMPPPFSTGNLKRRNFYITRESVARARTFDHWRDHLVDPLPGPLFPAALSEPQ